MARKALLCFALVMMLAGSFFGQTEGWKKYSNAVGNFTVLFPHDPQDSVIESDTQWESHTLMTVAPPNVYGVVYNFSKQEQKVDDSMFEIFKSRILRTLPNCEIGGEKPASPALGGYIGRWYRLNCGSSPNNKKMGVCNFYWGKHYAYAVVVTFPADAKEPAAGNKFFESFSLIDAKNDGWEQTRNAKCGDRRAYPIVLPLGPRTGERPGCPLVFTGGENGKELRGSIAAHPCKKNTRMGHPPWGWCNAKMGHRQRPRRVLCGLTIVVTSRSALPTQ